MLLLEEEDKMLMPEVVPLIACVVCPNAIGVEGGRRMLAEVVQSRILLLAEMTSSPEEFEDIFWFPVVVPSNVKGTFVGIFTEAVVKEILEGELSIKPAEEF
jgi:hypothetical protein